ncbi:hypothetical protein PAXRUDRAFT_13984 [Paxillus rubicundulus Ve08.2h10]|uniref:Uncharacterized protein n=1 Tax=Paxillus rubicundulus Ve08.2h10 TaxID=930991 RepID=A0A0D0D3M0_9AGAM|nr:hypothetical protein PAXRUDRAFT_13984 [Paxillus rubicundulus Ve08.2h10]
MANLNLKAPPNYAGPKFDIIREGLRHRATRIAAWDAQKEAEARAAAEVEKICRLREEEEEFLINEEAKCKQKEVDKKKPRMNTFVPGSSIADVLIQPPSQYALQKLSTFDYVEMWYFSLAGRLDASMYHDRSQVDDTFSISKVDDLLAVRPIASIKASCNVHPNHELTFLDFLSTKKANCWRPTSMPSPNSFSSWRPTHQFSFPLGKRSFSHMPRAFDSTGIGNSKLEEDTISQSSMVAYWTPSPETSKGTTTTMSNPRQVILFFPPSLFISPSCFFPHPPNFCQQPPFVTGNPPPLSTMSPCTIVIIATAPNPSPPQHGAVDDVPPSSLPLT